jgi:hypothetical protein
VTFIPIATFLAGALLSLLLPVGLVLALLTWHVLSFRRVPDARQLSQEQEAQAAAIDPAAGSEPGPTDPAAPAA